MSEIRRKYDNSQKHVNDAHIIIERRISDNLIVGCGNYSKLDVVNNINRSYVQLLKFNKDYYRFDSLTCQENKLQYDWKNIRNQDDLVSLEFEKYVPLNIICYKLSKMSKSSPISNIILQHFKSIGLTCSNELDELMNL